jgi:putative hemolysin
VAPFILAILILLNGFLALVEIAFVSSKRPRLEEMALKGRPGARLALQLLAEPERFFSAIQVGITLIGVFNGALGALAYADRLAAAVAGIPRLAPVAHQISTAIVVLGITYLSIVVGELAPKTLALRAPERIAVTAAPWIGFFIRIAFPVVSFLGFSTRLLIRALGMGGARQEESDRREEILFLVRLAAARREISSEQERIFARTMGLTALRASDIMIERKDMKTLSTSMSLTEALVEAHVSHHTRFPLVDSDGGGVIGYVNFKDIVSALQLNPSDPSLRGICRPIMKVSRDDSVAELLPRMIRQYQHVAVVADEGGAVLGMVSMEDIVETVVGDIYDEYDMLPSYIYPITETRFVVGGGARVHTLRDKLGLELPQVDEPLSQWLKEIAERPPRVEDRIRWKNATFIPRKISRTEIREVIVDKS